MRAGFLGSWGNYPDFPQQFSSCRWPDELRGNIARAVALGRTTLPYGAGRSYGDSCLAASDQVMDMKPMDRFIEADWNSGVLVAEPGVTLETILDLAVPKGWFLPVTPGTKFVTLGGAIANDVHGKNHHVRGTLGSHVRRFGLFRSDLGRLVCSPVENQELYAATIGGLGLTGVIEWAEIELVRIRSSELVHFTQRFENLEEFFLLSAELDHHHEFCVSWIDCTATGKGLGRGIYSAADFADDGLLEVARRRKISMPVTPPFSLVNNLSVPLINSLYWHRTRSGRSVSRTGYEPFFYPLDAVLHWNRMYGRRGFQQYQALLPDPVAQDSLRAMLKEISRSARGSFLAVLKRCGSAVSPGLLSFPRPGASLALDFPQSDGLQLELFPRLDAVVREAGGRLYPAKDAHMSGADFRRSYPDWPQVEARRDPALLSRFWQRVLQ